MAKVPKVAAEMATRMIPASRLPELADVGVMLELSVNLRVQMQNCQLIQNSILENQWQIQPVTWFPAMPIALL